MKPAKCRRCSKPVNRDEAVKIGGSRYHEECARLKPKSRQHWDESKHGWVHDGKSY